MNKIKVIIADDHSLFRKGLISIIEEFDNIEIIGEAENGKLLIEKIQQDKPDVILMDLKMPVMDGIEATRYIKHHHPEIKVIILTMYDDEKFILHLIELGANGYLLKNTSSLEVEKTIKKVIVEDFSFNENITRLIHKQLIQKKQQTPHFFAAGDFNEQELKILSLICEEMTVEEISKKIFLSPRTIEGYRQRLLKKTGAKNTAGIVKFAIKNGLVT